MYREQDSSDEGAVKRRSDRCIELAAMFKEVSKGTEKSLKLILSKFCLQEGVSKRKVSEYFTLLRSSGLIKLTNGQKGWRYDPESEWELFKVEI